MQTNTISVKGRVMRNPHSGKYRDREAWVGVIAPERKFEDIVAIDVRVVSVFRCQRARGNDQSHPLICIGNGVNFLEVFMPEDLD